MSICGMGWNCYLITKIYKNYVYLKGRSTETRRGREREIFHLLVYFPKDCNIWSWADTKLAARRILLVSHMGTEAQGLEPPSAIFQSHNKGARWEVE